MLLKSEDEIDRYKIWSELSSTQSKLTVGCLISGIIQMLRGEVKTQDVTFPAINSMKDNAESYRVNMVVNQWTRPQGCVPGNGR
jgi:hypothetical protein